MGKDKLKRFEELKTFPNVYQCFSFRDPVLKNSSGDPIDLKGKWLTEHFKNENPTCLELACGKGEYTVGLAKRFPETNFIGIDIKGARIHKGAKDAIEQNVKNAAFLRCKIELLETFFAQDEVSEIWITFTDPYPKDRHEKHRLTSPGFLDLYRKICKPGAIIHLKHDSQEFFDYTLEVLKMEGIEPMKVERDIHNTGASLPHLNEIITHYEKMHLKAGKSINYLSFKL